MSDIDVSPARVTTMAQMHEDAASAVTDLSSSLPPQPDGGMASDVLAAIVARLVQDADALALAEETVADALRDITRNYLRSDEAVITRFTDLSSGLEE